jgi:hypothetical protein
MHKYFLPVYTASIMGPTSSKTKSDIFMEAVNNTVISAVMNCSTSSTMGQSITVNGKYAQANNNNLTQTLSDVSTCQLTNDFIGKFQTQMEAGIKQAAEAASSGILGVLNTTTSDTDTTIRSSVRNSVTNESVSNIIKTIVAAQSITVNDEGGQSNNNTLTQANNSIMNAVSSLSNSISAVTTIKDALDQSASAKTTNPISEIIDSAANFFSGPIKWIVLAVVAVIVGIVVFFNTGGGKQTLNMAQQMMPPRMPMPPGLPPGMMPPGLPSMPPMPPGMPPGMQGLSLGAPMGAVPVRY